MHFEGAVTINAPQEKVWEFMTDPDTVSECVPGLKSVEVIEPARKFRAISNLAIGKVRMPFTNVIEWVELDAPSRALMKVHGETSSSVVDIKGELILSGNADDTTDVNWSAEVIVM